jgi:hypothetical protein
MNKTIYKKNKYILNIIKTILKKRKENRKNE